MRDIWTSVLLLNTDAFLNNVTKDVRVFMRINVGQNWVTGTNATVINM